MATLARLFGDLVPAPLAVEAGRGWLVLDDFGKELGWDVPVEVVEDVARTFARLQVEATAHVGRRRGYLFFDWTDACVAHQAISSPPAGRDRRHASAVPDGTAGPPPAAGD